MQSNYSTLIIYYFSGTGNARQTAKWMGQKAEASGLDVHIISIDRFKKIEIPDFEGRALIGFGSPTHGFNMAPYMLKFIARFPRKVNADLFLYNTRAGMKMYKLFTGGLNGVAIYLPAFMLKLKGYSIRGWRSIDLPSNWISLHPGIRDKVVESIFQRWECKAKNYMQLLLLGKRKYYNWYELPLDIAITPVSLGYYFAGRFALSKTFMANYNCNQCGLCEKECPTNSIKMVDNRPYWKFTCESCMRCMNRCPKRAIETPHAQVVLVWWALFGIVPAVIYRSLKDYGIESGFLFELCYYALYYIAGALGLYLSYWILHLLIRYKLFNYLFSYSSFTHWKFWRRYKYGLSKR